VGHGRYGEGKVIARLSAEVQKSQKRPERGNQLLRRRSATLARALQKKVSHSLSVPSADVLAERLEQIRSTANVLPKSRLLHPAMRSKPVAEGGHKGWIGRHTLDWFRRADPTPDELSMEKLHSKRWVIADLSSLEMWASAPTKMANKGIKRVAIDVRQDTALPQNEAAEMSGGSNISNGARRRVSVTFELICERVDVWSTDSAPEPPQRLGRGEILL
jgi:hypothetical protein